MRTALASTLAALALAAAGCGSSGPKNQPPPACLAFGSTCTQSAECCSQVCFGGACLCNPAPGAKCAASSQCCPGQVCAAGACAQGCRPAGDTCASAGDCCSGACDATGHCAATCSYGTCARTSDCCIGEYCALGTCWAGACGVFASPCGTSADCCQSPKHLTCSASSSCQCGAYASACASDADCCSPEVCSGGYCHPSPGTVYDGQPCLANADCRSGTCVGAAPPSSGACCTSGGGSCTVGSAVSLCCSPTTCNDAASTGTFACAACLTWTNSGTPGPGVAACTRDSQCCSGQYLGCDTASGKCGKLFGVTCGSTAECFSTAACSTQAGYTGNVCCRAYGTACFGSPCCDGLTCAQDQGYVGAFSCHVAPGGGCSSDANCAAGDNCLNGKCCTHFGSCTTGAECCSGVCDAFGSCGYAPPYGQCQNNGDCAAGAFSGYPNVCGGNPVVGPNLCCPAPGDVCTLGQATCCEATDLCQVPLTAPTSPALCCRDYQAGCTRNEECCTGVCGGMADGCCSPVTFACNVGADCCGGKGLTPSQNCSAAKTCCFVQGVYIGPVADPTVECCSGRKDSNDLCK